MQRRGVRDVTTEFLLAALVALAALLAREIRAARSAVAKEEPVGTVDVKLAELGGELAIIRAGVKELLRMHRDPMSLFATSDVKERVEEIERMVQKISDDLRRHYDIG